jgi:hypothetical protein
LNIVILSITTTALSRDTSPVALQSMFAAPLFPS